jgi:class 3 adenylate cyclase
MSDVSGGDSAGLSASASAGPAAERVSDGDRDAAVAQLREHVVVGRLTLDEFSQRIGVALEARVRGELDRALVDLPVSVAPPDEAPRRRGRRWLVAVMSGSHARGRWRVAERTTAIAVMGGCDLDLRQAEIAGPEVLITAVAFWGGVTIVVPEGFEVEMEGFSIMGGRHVRVRNVPIIPGSPRIRIKGIAIMGGVDVRTRTTREIGLSLVDQVLRSVMPAVTGEAGSPGGPVDLDSLRRDLNAQLRAHRHGPRPGDRHGHHNHGHSHNQWQNQVQNLGQNQGQDAGHGHGMQDDVLPVDAPDAADASAPGAASPSSSDATATPLAGPGVTEGTVTILFSDMVDYAGMTERLGDQQSRDVLREHHRIVRELLSTHGGREINVQGDGFMVAFGGVARALRCAGAMQRGFAAYSAMHPDLPIRVHVGVHTGEAMAEADDFLGHTVIVASRIAGVAGPGEILVSSLSAQMVERTEEFAFRDERDVTLKGLSRPQRVTTLIWAP